MRMIRRVGLGAWSLAFLMGAPACGEGSSDNPPDDATVEQADMRTNGAACETSHVLCATEISIGVAGERAMELRGDFMAAGWSSGVAMTKVGPRWVASVPIRPGSRAEYKFCSDPRADGSCSTWKADGHAPSAANGNNVIGAASTCSAPSCADSARDVRFVAVGDTGKGNANQTAVANAMAAKCRASGCEFGLLLGDNIYDSGVSSATDALFNSRFERVYAPVGVPFYVVLGNHDYGGNGLGNEPAKGQFEIDHTSHSTIWKMPSAYYQFVQSDVTFVALDTNAILYGRDSVQRTDIARWLADASTTWKIAIGHHPYASNGPHGNAGNYDGRPTVPVLNGTTMKSFAEDIVCGKVDVYLCGHDHVREWMGATCSGTELVVSGAGAETSRLPGTNATRYQSVDLGFLYVTISGRRLVAEFVDTNSHTNFTRTLTK